MTATQHLADAILSALHDAGGTAKAKDIAATLGHTVIALNQAASYLVLKCRMRTYGQKGARTWMVA